MHSVGRLKIGSRLAKLGTSPELPDASAYTYTTEVRSGVHSFPRATGSNKQSAMESSETSCTTTTTTSTTSSSCKMTTKKRRRSRTVFTANQLMELERVFDVTRHPSASVRRALAQRIGTPETTIQVRYIYVPRRKRACVQCIDATFALLRSLTHLASKLNTPWFGRGAILQP